MSVYLLGVVVNILLLIAIKIIFRDSDFEGALLTLIVISLLSWVGLVLILNFFFFS